MENWNLSVREKKRIRGRLEQTGSAAEARRLIALLALADGAPPSDVDGWVGVSRQCLYQWRSRYQQSSRVSEALVDRSRSGRPSLWDEGMVRCLCATLEQSPDELGYPAVNWTVGLLQKHLEFCFGQSLSEESVRRRLHELGYVWKRPRYVLDPDPQREKKTGVAPPLQRAWARTVILFVDETDLRFFPPLGAAWALRGERAKVRISGYNARRVISGVLNVRTGHRLWLVQVCQRSVEFQEVLRAIHYHYRGWRVVLFLDEDSSHTAQASQACAADLGIELCWLPVRCPELNPLESLWRYAKAKRCVNRQYASIEQQTQRFLQELKSMSPHQALSTSGVLSGNFWLLT